MKKAEITKDVTIGEIIKKHPEAAHVFVSYGLHCVDCHIAAWETIEQAAVTHGITKRDIHSMVNEINRAIKKKKKNV